MGYFVENVSVTQNTPNILGANDENKLGVNKNNSEKLGVKLNKNQSKMLELIETNNKITIVEMANFLSISKTAIENNIKKLREKSILSRIGSDKTGIWKIIH